MRVAYSVRPIVIRRTRVVSVWFLAFALAVVIVPSGIETNRRLLVGTVLVVVAILPGRSFRKTAISGGPQTIDVRPLSVAVLPPAERQRWTSGLRHSSNMEDSMQYTWKALSAVWIAIFGVFGLIASGTVTGPGQLMVVLVGLAAPAIILTIDEKVRKAARTAPHRASSWPNAGFRNIGRRTRSG